MVTTTQDPRQQALVQSLRQRYAEARSRGDTESKRALFREAVYLGIQPDLLDVDPEAAA
jgi:hypothetical protein